MPAKKCQPEQSLYVYHQGQAPGIFLHRGEMILCPENNISKALFKDPCERGELWAGTAPTLKKQLRPLVGTLESSGRFSQGSWACILGPVRQLTPHISAELWLNWANFAPRGHLLMYGEGFGCHNWGHSWPQHLGMEARDATRHCTMHSAGLMKIIQSQVSIVPRLSNLDLQEERKEGVIHGFTVCH